MCVAGGTVNKPRSWVTVLLFVLAVLQLVDAVKATSGHAGTGGFGSWELVLTVGLGLCGLAFLLYASSMRLAVAPAARSWRSELPGIVAAVILVAAWKLAPAIVFRGKARLADAWFIGWDYLIAGGILAWGVERIRRAMAVARAVRAARS
jgi:hypothetical protein